MSRAAPPRQLISEFFLELKLTKRKHIVVEGRSDERFFRAWLQGCTLSCDITVSAVETVEVPTGDVLTFGLNDGEQGRVLALAARADESGVDLRCVADRDCGHLVADFQFQTLLWTDYPALESYAVDAVTLEKANLLSFGGRLPHGSILLPSLAHALRELFAVRQHQPDLPKPNYAAGLKGSGGSLAEFDVAAAVSAEIKGLLDGFERSDSEDARVYAYGHDVGELLLAAFGNTLKNQVGLRSVSAVEGALRSAIHAVGEFATEPMFVELSGWLEADAPA